VIVFVVISPEPGVWRGDTRLTSEPGKPRMLRVTLNNDLAPDERIAVLAHELQHVVEIAGAPDVVDGDSMRRLFKRIEYLVNSTGNRYETRAAQQIEHRVRREITRSRCPGARHDGSAFRPISHPRAIHEPFADVIVRRPLEARDARSATALNALEAAFGSNDAGNGSGWVIGARRMETRRVRDIFRPCGSLAA
jgi:hypothetical protein